MSTPASAPAIPSALNPRIERSRTTILEATLDELAEAGYGALTIESVARRAGASKATVYRHRTRKLDLVADAVTASSRGRPPADRDTSPDLDGL